MGKSDEEIDNELNEILKCSQKMEIVADNEGHFNAKQERRVIKTREKALFLKSRLDNCTSLEIENSQLLVDRETRKLKQEWPALFSLPYENIFVHFDLDMFYASVEMLQYPQYRNIPLAVGSELMLCTCNYKAREYGVKAGMPGYLALKYCPSLVIVLPNMKKYNYFSEIVMGILTSYNSAIEIYGIDEAAMCFNEESFANALSVYNSTMNLDGNQGINLDFNYENVNFLVENIRKMVFDKTGLTVSAGISVCRGLSKFSCSINKPNGQFIMSENFNSYLDSLPTDKINGIGKATREVFEKSLDIKTVLDLKEKMKFVFIIFRPKTAVHLFRLSFGLSVFDNQRIFSTMSDDKSKSASHSFIPTCEYSEICNILWMMCEELWRRLEKSQVTGFIITIKIRYDNFNSFTRQKKILKFLKRTEDLFNESYSLLEENFFRKNKGKIEIVQKIGMIGVAVGDLHKKTDVNLLELFKSSKEAKSRSCPICGQEFYNEPHFIVESHANNCLNLKKQEELKFNNTLHKYMKENKKGKK